MIGETCKRRVWDNGDKTNCGKPVVVGKLCDECRIDTLDALRKEVISLRAVLLTALANIEELDADDVNDRLALARGFGVNIRRQST